MWPLRIPMVIPGHSRKVVRGALLGNRRDISEFKLLIPAKRRDNALVCLTVDNRRVLPDECEAAIGQVVREAMMSEIRCAIEATRRGRRRVCAAVILSGRAYCVRKARV